MQASETTAQGLWLAGVCGSILAAVVWFGGPMAVASKCAAWFHQQLGPYLKLAAKWMCPLTYTATHAVCLVSRDVHTVYTACLPHATTVSFSAFALVP